jgi:hypothetical protein
VILLETSVRLPSGARRLVMTSPMPNTPIANGTKPIPSARSGRPKVKRVPPVLPSTPTSPRIRPKTIMAMALSTEPCASTTAAIRPTTISEIYSGAPKDRPTCASGGANRAMMAVAIVPANKEARAAVARAGPARPWRAIWWPSMQVTTDEVSPGMLTRIAVVEPPYCAP